jgi:hypothetical protein
MKICFNIPFIIECCGGGKNDDEGKVSENILRGNYYFKFLVLDGGIRKPEALLDMSINYIAMGHRLNRENKQILLWMCLEERIARGSNK